MPVSMKQAAAGAPGEQRCCSYRLHQMAGWPNLSMVRSASGQAQKEADSCTLFIKPQTQRKGQISKADGMPHSDTAHPCTSENNIQATEHTRGSV